MGKGRIKMSIGMGTILYVNIICISLAYIYLFKIRKLIGFQLGMNIAVIIGGFFSIVAGIVLIYEFPFHFTLITIICTLTGMLLGSLFGALFDFQTLLTGYVNGLMMGIMAPMVGAAAKQSMPFLYFSEIVFMISIVLIISSAKQS